MMRCGRLVGSVNTVCAYCVVTGSTVSATAATATHTSTGTMARRAPRRQCAIANNPSAGTAVMPTTRYSIAAVPRALRQNAIASAGAAIHAINGPDADTPITPTTLRSRFTGHSVQDAAR